MRFVDNKKNIENRQPCPLKSQMSLRRKRDNLGMRRLFWELNIGKKSPYLRSIMIVNDFFYLFSHQVLYVLFYVTFFFEGYKSTPVWENKPRPHSTMSAFNTPASFLTFVVVIILWFCVKLFISVRWVSACLWNIWQSSRSNESIITHCNILWWWKFKLSLKVTTHLLLKIGDYFKWEF